MKTLTAEMTAHINQEVTTLSTIFKLTRTDGTVLRFTDHDRDIVYGGETYEADSGFTRTTIQTGSNFAADNLDVTGLLAKGLNTFLSSEAIEDDDLRAGLYDFAEVEISLVNWQDPDGFGEIAKRKGNLGQVTIQDNTFTAEIRGLNQRLARNIGDVYTPDCRVDLGSTPCGIDLVNGTYNEGTTHAGLLYREEAEAESVPDARRSLVVPADFVAEADPDPATLDEQALDFVVVDEDGVVTLQQDAEDGTPLRPYRVSTPADLDDIRNDGVAYYVLENDIDMSGFGLFDPIDDWTGTLDGRGYTIRGLDLDHSAAPRDVGLFGTGFAGTVRRLGIVDATVDSGGSAEIAGPLVAICAGTVEDCYSLNCLVVTNGDWAGGLLGRISPGSSVQRCFAASVASGAFGTNVGGIAGRTSGALDPEDEQYTYFDSDRWGSTSAGGDNPSALPKTTAEMVQEATFETYDFQNDWRLPAMAAEPEIDFNDVDPDTIDRPSGSFITEGFVVDLDVAVVGSLLNDGIYRVDTVAALTLTLAAAETLIDYTGIDSSADVNTGTEEITVADTTPLTDGDGPYRLTLRSGSFPDALPALDESTDYWVSVESATTIILHTTQASAAGADDAIVNLTGTQTGVFDITAAGGVIVAGYPRHMDPGRF